MENRASSVSSLVSQIKQSLEGEFRGVSVVGEVSNLSYSGAGHYYFTLSDAQSSLSCCLFKMDAMRNPYMREVKNGDKIIASGSIGVYAKRGTFQLVAKRVTPFGTGDLKQQLEALKKRLRADGLFDMEAKKQLPRFPRRIGLITAHGSAAYHDFLNVTRRRSAWMDILLAPAFVQGDHAPESLRRALHNLIEYHLNAPENKKLDVIVLCRGGGSLEDLWAFNDEGLAFDLFNCPIPTVSAIGHEVDYSISDFVADKRCETPTAAAEVLTAAQVQLLTQMNSLRRSLKSKGDHLALRERRRLERVSPTQTLRKIDSRLHQYSRRLERCKIQGRLAEFTGLHDKTMRLEECSRSLNQFKGRIGELEKAVENQYALLKLLNPKNILGRGYSYVKSEDGRLVGSTQGYDELGGGTSLSIHFNDGERKVLKEK